MSVDKCITIQLTKGKSVTIDECDSDLAQYKWYVLGNPPLQYAAREVRIDGVPKTVLMHRIILERITQSPLDSKIMCDHVNGDKLDNRRSNLRKATRAENQRNRKLSKASKSGFKGVRSDRPGKWIAKIRCDNKRYYLGTFDTPEEAYEAYCKAAKELHGDFARLE